AIDPLDRRARREGRRPRRRARSGELLTRPGQDDHTVLAVGADVVERVGQLAVRKKSPAEGLALGVQRHLEHAVAALHPHGLVLVRVLVECAHLDLLSEIYSRASAGGAPAPRRLAARPTSDRPRNPGAVEDRLVDAARGDAVARRV